ncbi:(deoxy)nucleoside triphosphate pyrophosphohydrolase [Candidatus Pelagibacter sp. HIMB1709]|uniref:(deoxy)nucleoside triphosphate pyrophosphohydrolase n=1 Tax=Candidatus Pelagibacter sp. HIMB1709 TaxID=3413367 RepID=UPI003F831370
MKYLKVVAAVIKQKDKILIARRKKGKHLELKWEYPGGKLEKYEDEIAALKRELKEEFSIDTEISKYLTESFYEYENININLRAYLVENFSGNFNLKDHDKIDWIKIEDIEKYDFAPADIPINNYLIKHGL